MGIFVRALCFFSLKMPLAFGHNAILFIYKKINFTYYDNHS